MIIFPSSVDEMPKSPSFKFLEGPPELNEPNVVRGRRKSLYKWLVTGKEAEPSSPDIIDKRKVFIQI